MQYCYVQRDPTQTYMTMTMSLSRRSKLQEDLVVRQRSLFVKYRVKVHAVLLCTEGSNSDLHDDVMMMSLSRRSKGLVARQPPRRRVRMFFVSRVKVHAVLLRTEGSNSDLHDDVTEQKK